MANDTDVQSADFQATAQCAISGLAARSRVSNARGMHLMLQELARVRQMVAQRRH
jgi:hypothetical protein